jgi:hypothetical protein
LNLSISALNTSKHEFEKQEIKLIIGIKRERTYQITPVANPTPSQKLILESWIKG